MKKSILVGDIGSTKSTWWAGGTRDTELHLDGFNPVMHSATAKSNFFKTLDEGLKNKDFAEVWYYGTGIIGDREIADVQNHLSKMFPKSKIHVASDLLGAAVATCGFEPGTVVILGTGSHAAVYDGNKIIRQANSLGYVLGDEGGGSDIGKAFIQAYFYHEMPDEIAVEMEKKLPEGRNGLLQALQSSATPNQYLAEFARLATTFQEHPWVKSLIISRFKLFIERHLLPLHSSGPVHIVGSIGCIFARLIQQQLTINGLTAGIFVPNPSRRLFDIHNEYEQKEI